MFYKPRFRRGIIHNKASCNCLANDAVGILIYILINEISLQLTQEFGALPGFKISHILASFNNRGILKLIEVLKTDEESRKLLSTSNISVVPLGNKSKQSY